MPAGPLSLRYPLIRWLDCSRASMNDLGIQTNLLMLPRIEPRSRGYATRSCLSVWVKVLNYILANLNSLKEQHECLTEANSGPGVNAYDPSVRCTGNCGITTFCNALPDSFSLINSWTLSVPSFCLERNIHDLRHINYDHDSNRQFNTKTGIDDFRMYNKRLSKKTSTYNWTSVIFPSNFLESLASVARRATQHSCPQCCRTDHTSSPCLARWIRSLLWDKLDFHKFHCAFVPWRVCIWFLHFNLKCAFIWTYSAYSASHFGPSVEARDAFVIRSKGQAFSNLGSYLKFRELYLSSSLRYNVSERPSRPQTGCGRAVEKNSYSKCREYRAWLVAMLGYPDLTSPLLPHSLLWPFWHT